MKIWGVSIIVLWCISIFASLHDISNLSKSSLRDAVRQSIITDARPTVRRQLAERWGVQKKMERWHAVMQSAFRALDIAVQSTKARDTRYAVRVLLDEKRFVDGSTCSWELMSGGGFVLCDDRTGTVCGTIAKPTLIVSYKHGAFYINNKRYGEDALCIIPEHGTTMLDGITYHGDFIFVRHKNVILCINSIELESYVSSVLKSESWPGWPGEVNKVFAIMSRSYVLSHMLSAQKQGRPYHVRNTNAHQNYHGIHTNTIIHDAVNATAGMILVYNQKPVLAMFDACCGGIIPAHMSHGIDFEKEPYLARSYACTFCRSCRLYAWEKKIALSDFEKKLQEAELCHDCIHDVAVVAHDKAGLVKTVHVKTKNGVKSCTGRQLYSAISEIKSYTFDIKKQHKHIIVSGYGHGHHLGGCQWGIREMVRLGYSYQQILSFFYPGTKLTAIA